MTRPQLVRNALPVGAALHEYRIEQVLGAGGFGITYLARDANLDKAVAIKEYLPSELAHRAGAAVEALSTEREADYKWGLDRFLQEARTLARFSHPNIVRVLRYFEANGTAYMVMDYERGESLKSRFAAPPAEAELRRLLAPLLDGLAAVHAGGFLHRDIKPDNIILRADGTPVLIDFGAARNALAGGTRSLTAILTPGYAPLEQYSGEGKQGPWTDLYAMGGVLFRAVAGENPPDAVTRLKNDTVPAKLAGAATRYSRDFLQAVQWALTLDERKRPQSVQAWRGAFEAAPTLKVEQPAPSAAAPRRRWKFFAGIAAAVLVVALGAAILKQRAARDDIAKAEVGLPPAVAEKLQRLQRDAEAEFRSADTDGNGHLSPAEVRGRFPALARDFARLDADGDGRIAPREFFQFRRMQLERRLAKKAG